MAFSDRTLDDQARVHTYFGDYAAVNALLGSHSGDAVAQRQIANGILTAIERLVRDQRYIDVADAWAYLDGQHLDSPFLRSAYLSSLDRAKILITDNGFGSLKALCTQRIDDDEALTRIADSIKSVIPDLASHKNYTAMRSISRLLDEEEFQDPRFKKSFKGVAQYIEGAMGLKVSSSEAMPQDRRGGSWRVHVLIGRSNSNRRYAATVSAGCHHDEGPKKIINYWATSKRNVTPNRRKYYIPEVLRLLARASEESTHPAIQNAAKRQLGWSLMDVDRHKIKLSVADRAKYLHILGR